MSEPCVQPGHRPDDERHWAAVADRYDHAKDIHNLENGYFGGMARPVMRAFQAHAERLNHLHTTYVRMEYDRHVADSIRARLADAIGATTVEIALTRGATEALQNLIVNYQPLRRGEAVLCSDLDYDSMLYAINHLVQRQGAELIRLTIPDSASAEQILGIYAQCLRQHPRIRLMLLTHVSDRTGQALPAAQLAALARSHDVDVILDAAHSWWNLDFDFKDIDVDFAGFSLHKWVGAPLGLGFMYVKRHRLADISPHFADEDYDLHDIRSRVHVGTMSVANVLAIPDALDFQQSIGMRDKALRLRYLRDYWVRRVRHLDALQIMTSDNPEDCGAITSLRLKGQVTAAQNAALARRLREHHRIMTVHRNGLASGSCVRVTPSLSTRLADLDQLVMALHAVAAS